MRRVSVPWDEPTGIYADAGPPSGCAEFTAEGVRWQVVATAQVGCDTGRRRYLVRCVDCGVVVHEATTGPRGWMEQHLWREHGWTS